MSEKKTRELSDEEKKIIAQFEKSKKDIEKATADTKSAKEDLDDASQELEDSKGDDKKYEEAKKAFEAARAEYLKKKAEEEDVRILNAQNGKYLAPEKERNTFHVLLDKPVYNKQTGEKLSKAYVQKFKPAEFKQFLQHGKGLGFTFVVKWNPELYNHAR